VEPTARTRWYPVVLDLAGRRCLVVGGGPVAVRKAEGLFEAGAEVTVVAPDIDPALEGRGATLLARPYRSPEAGDYRYVVAATGVPEVDATVAADAEAAGVWVNSADDPEHCTVLLPSVHRDGPVTVAVSTGGASPAMAAWLRRRIAAGLDDNLGGLAELLDAARRRLLYAGRPTTAVDFTALLEGEAGRAARRGDLDAARRLLDQAVDAALAED
jgi:siroheme synthase-like protein